MIQPNFSRAHSAEAPSRTIKSCEAWQRLRMSEVHKLNENPRLSYKEIQQITRSLIKDKKAHENNVGVLTNIKGKMYCLKLGQVARFKQFSHYFYSSHYRRKLQYERNLGLVDSGIMGKSGTADQKYRKRIMINVEENEEQSPFDDGVFNTEVFDQEKITNDIKKKFMNKSFSQNNREDSVSEIDFPETISTEVEGALEQIGNQAKNYKMRPIVTFQNRKSHAIKLMERKQFLRKNPNKVEKENPYFDSQSIRPKIHKNE